MVHYRQCNTWLIARKTWKIVRGYNTFKQFWVIINANTLALSVLYEVSHT